MATYSQQKRPLPNSPDFGVKFRPKTLCASQKQAKETFNQMSVRGGEFHEILQHQQLEMGRSPERGIFRLGQQRPRLRSEVAGTNDVSEGACVERSDHVQSFETRCRHFCKDFPAFARFWLIPPDHVSTGVQCEELRGGSTFKFLKMNLKPCFPFPRTCALNKPPNFLDLKTGVLGQSGTGKPPRGGFEAKFWKPNSGLTDLRCRGILVLQNASGWVKNRLKSPVIPRPLGASLTRLPKAIFYGDEFAKDVTRLRQPVGEDGWVEARQQPSPTGTSTPLF
ncbi:hypothetical protein C8J57DRAFT_1220411 [Mycena rebaudengoi]|nr:hypothetical protein C8J57DRAFT_1220411 [Mycena rebaudengoi]